MVVDRALTAIGTTDAILLLAIVPRRHQLRDLERPDAGLIGKSRVSSTRSPGL